MSNDFIEAIKAGNLTAVQSLLASDPSLLQTQENGVSMIMLALYYRQIAIADFLASQASALSFLRRYLWAKWGVFAPYCQNLPL